MEQITPEKALQITDEVFASVNANRVTHVALQSTLEYFKNEIQLRAKFEIEIVTLNAEVERLKAEIESLKPSETPDKPDEAFVS